MLNKNKQHFFYSLDYSAGRGLVNPLLIQLEETSHAEFEFYLAFILEKCINVNRSFSIWIKKSPATLLENLKNSKLKHYFDRTEFSYEGDQWFFPKLFQVFATFVEKEEITASDVVDYLFETFDFFSEPEVFVKDIVGYDRLKQCIEECPLTFKKALILKMIGFIDLNKAMDIGLNSYRYLNDEMQCICPNKKQKIQMAM